jgi:uncharacterized protein (DUF1778 family)
MLDVACERVQAVLLDQIFIGINSDKFFAFNAMLDSWFFQIAGLNG